MLIRNWRPTVRRRPPHREEHENLSVAVGNFSFENRFHLGCRTGYGTGTPSSCLAAFAACRLRFIGALSVFGGVAVKRLDRPSLLRVCCRDVVFAMA